MALLAFCSVQSVILNGGGQGVIKLHISLTNGSSADDVEHVFNSPATPTVTLIPGLVSAMKEYIEVNMGVAFGVDDRLRLFYPQDVIA